MGRYRVRLVTVVRADSVIQCRSARLAGELAYLRAAVETLREAGFEPEVPQSEQPESPGWEFPARRVESLPPI